MKAPVLPPLLTKYRANASADVVVVGAGLIGLSIALELASRGAQVTVVERGFALREASVAAAGMLAVEDPGNPAELLPLARMSAAKYPQFLRRLEALGGVAVPFQTETALQYEAKGVRRLAERSIDPRQLAEAVLQAVKESAITLLEQTEFRAAHHSGSDVVYAGGAWSGALIHAEVRPVKGQMLRVRMPEGCALGEVHRNEHVYVVPRTVGAQAGTALIGATVEDVGFDTTVRADDLARLRRLAAEMVPALASAERVEAWAGLRPATPDGLPVIGRVAERQWVASGHYRNGVLLTPGTAAVVADMVMGMTTEVDVVAFAPGRFGTGFGG